MSKPSWLGFAWLFNRQLTRAMFWSVVVVAAGVTVNLVGIRLLGDLATWQRWLSSHSRHFFLWRAFLYLVTAIGWWLMRRRLLLREPSEQSRHRLARTEIAALASIVLLEASSLLRHP